MRVLGQCGGTDADVFEGMLWASGVAIAGVPANPNPARVINLSLGGPGACTQAIQEAVDDALAQGAVVVAAAGNESDDAANYAPANCSGVITVAALNVAGERAFYSNFGTRVDLAAPAGETVDDATVSHSNSGETSPGDPAYSLGIGTSFSAPLVSGVASLMLGRNPTMTPGRVLGILQGTARDFPAGTTCGTGNLCGIGMLDAGAAVASTIPATGDLPPGIDPGRRVLQRRPRPLFHHRVDRRDGRARRRPGRHVPAHRPRVLRLLRPAAMRRRRCRSAASTPAPTSTSIRTSSAPTRTSASSC